MDRGAGPFAVEAVGECNLAAMGAGDLLGQSETNAAAGRFGRVERHEKVVGVGDAHAAIVNRDKSRRIVETPAHFYWLSAVGERGIDGVPEKVDEHLLQLIGIGIDFEGRSRLEHDREPLLEKNDAFHQGATALA